MRKTEGTEDRVYSKWVNSVKSARKAKNILQEHMAEALGLSRTQYVNIEALRASTSIYNALLINSILGIDFPKVPKSVIYPTIKKATKSANIKKEKKKASLLKKKQLIEKELNNL